MTFLEICAWVAGAGAAGTVVWRVFIGIRNGVRATKAEAREAGKIEAEREASESRARDETRARMERMEPKLDQVLTVTLEQSKDLAVLKHQASESSKWQDATDHQITDLQKRLVRQETKS